MQEKYIHVISTKKYQVEISYFPDTKQVHLLFISKLINNPIAEYVASVIDVEEKIFWGEMRKYRKLYLEPSTPLITLPGKFFQIQLKKVTLSDEQRKRLLENTYDTQYFQRRCGKMHIDVALDPHHTLVSINVLESTKWTVNTVETTVSLSRLLGKSSLFKEKLPEDQSLGTLFSAIHQSATLKVDWTQKYLKISQNINPIKLYPIRIIKSQESSSISSSCEKVGLFRHIFLTELVTHMITNQFGRKKNKAAKYREGNYNYQYEDEELEELRSFGLRLSEFKDYPFKQRKLPNETVKTKTDQEKKNQQREESEDDYEDDDEDEDQDYGYTGIPDFDSSDEEEIKQKKEGKKTITEGKKASKEGKQKTKLGRMKEKMQKTEGICNFTFISGRDKSNINSMRYCLHQMTQETDKTQALIDFVRLVWKVEKQKPDELNKIACFLKQFRTKLWAKSCLEEYTSESFFHRILNTGLRALKRPSELAYLRLPFSHLFWSIKRIYHRHKRSIFAKKTSENRNIMLYRGFKIDENELKRIRKSLNGYVQIEGFLSTTLKVSVADLFVTNAKMVIEIPVANLGGMHDNGFANISFYSFYRFEREVLINAFNVFKILSLHSAVHDDNMVIHTIALEYGSIKPVEEKVQKSEKLLDAEFFYFENMKELKKAREDLEKNKKEMTIEGYQKLAALLPKAQKQLKKRAKFLEKWKEEDYLSAVKKLSQWEKELIINAKHQQKGLNSIHNYGQLLYYLGEYRRAVIYSDRRVKQVQLDRAVQGHRWRNCEFLIHKEQTNRKILYKSYFLISRPKDAFLQGQKLLDAYTSTNVKKSDERYYELFYNISCACCLLDKVKEEKDLKEKLLKIVQQNELYDTILYQRLKSRQQQKVLKEKSEKKQQGTSFKQQQKQQQQKQKSEQKDEESEQKEKQEERKEMKERESKIRKVKQELEDIRLYSAGKYSTQYLTELGDFVYLLYKWKQWGMVIEQGMSYLQIRKRTPYLQCRPTTCYVFRQVMKSCYITRQQGRFYSTSAELASFIPPVLHNVIEFTPVHYCIDYCVNLEWSRAARPVIINLINSTIKFKLQQQYVHTLMQYGYYVLLMSVTEQTVVNKFVHWIDRLYKQQQCTQTQQYDILVKIAISFNDGPGGLLLLRNKDNWDSKIVQYVRKLRQGQSPIFAPFVWQGRIAPLIPFHHPSHSFPYIFNSIQRGIQIQLMGRQESVMLFQYFQHFRKTRYNVLDLHSIEFYVRYVHIFSRLHLSDWHLHHIPSMFGFCQYKIRALALMQADQMGIDFETCISNTSHLSEDSKRTNLMSARQWKHQMKYQKRQIMKESENDASLRRAKKVYARYQHYQLFTSNRRLRLFRKSNIS